MGKAINEVQSQNDCPTARHSLCNGEHEVSLYVYFGTIDASKNLGF